MVGSCTMDMVGSCVMDMVGSCTMDMVGTQNLASLPYLNSQLTGGLFAFLHR
jgi:hypothetical protein